MTERIAIEDLETPVLVVDLDAVGRNIVAMQGYCDEHGFAFRPHIKTHKIPAIAHLQLSAGAVGVTCQKLGEAEVMAEAGVRDILVTFPLVGRAKAERLAALSRTVRMSVAADSPRVARDLSDVLSLEGLSVGFLVDCDTGLGRTGVQSPKQAADLAVLVDSLPGLRFAGLMTYPTEPESGPWLGAAREMIEALGLQVGRVSGGGTPTAFRTHEIGEVTEIRAGTYVYGDVNCIDDRTVSPEDCAIGIRSMVVSRPTRDRAILDAGSKALSSDPPSYGRDGYGLITKYPDAKIYALDEEHGYVEIRAGLEGLEVGEVVTIIPNHACTAVNMHDETVAHRRGEIVAVWPVAARGRIK
jgi:D-serine deaminase-like pyridoxal phosphate-dependent protein